MLSPKQKGKLCLLLGSSEGMTQRGASYHVKTHGTYIIEPCMVTGTYIAELCMVPRTPETMLWSTDYHTATEGYVLASHLQLSLSFY